MAVCAAKHKRQRTTFNAIEFRLSTGLSVNEFRKNLVSVLRSIMKYDVHSWEGGGYVVAKRPAYGAKCSAPRKKLSLN